MADMLTSGFSGFLTPEQTAPLFEQAKETSLVQRIARQVSLGPNGVSIPNFTGNIEAHWVNEMQRKPSSSIGATSKLMVPHKIAGTVVYSNELVRANPLGVLQEVNAQMSEAIAKAFDAAVLYGTDTVFTTHLSQADVVQISEANTYADLNGVLRVLLASRKQLTGWVLDQAIEPDLNIPQGVAGQSLWVENAAESNAVVRAGRLLGRPAYLGKVADADHPDVLGFAGDWSQILWGQVGGMSIRTSSEGAITREDGSVFTLLDHNATAVIFEAELGVLINDIDSFVRLDRAAPETPGTGE